MSQAPALLESAHDDCLDELLDKHVLEELDYHFARTMAALVDEVTPPEVLLGLALAARAVGLGHLCADLKALGGAQPLDREGRPVGYKLPATAGWVALLARSSLVSSPEEAGRAPLVLDRPNGRLYLARYWAYQHDLARLLGERAGRLEAVDGALLSEGLTRYFGNAGAAVNHQRLAALIAVLRNFSVISGGPGTGKTTTVTRILALLIEQRLHAGQAPPKILLLAPTGKAAARLGEAIKQQKDGLSCTPEVLRAMPGMDPQLAINTVDMRRQFDPNSGLPPVTLTDGTPLVVAAGSGTYNVRSRARLKNGAWAELDAVVRLGGAPSSGLAFSALRWQDGTQL